jgi:hypothetical protein
LIAPATAMLAFSPSASAEMTNPPACFDDPTQPGCPVGGGGTNDGGAGEGGDGGNDGGGGDGYAYRTFITDDEVSWEPSAMLVTYDLSQWASPYDFSDAVRAYWDAHSTAAVCVSSEPNCDFVFLFHHPLATPHKVYVEIVLSK